MKADIGRSVTVRLVGVTAADLALLDRAYTTLWHLAELTGREEHEAQARLLSRMSNDLHRATDYIRVGAEA